MEQPTDPAYVVVGHLSKPHGTKGEFYVWSLTDRPESTFSPGIRLRVSGPEGDDPDPELPPFRIAAARPYRKGFLVVFDGIADRTSAEILQGRYLVRRFEETEPLDEDEIFYHQLLGLTVVTTEGEELGRIREIYGVRPADLLDVEGPERSHLIPFTRDIVVDWSVEEGRMVVDPPEGLLEL